MKELKETADMMVSEDYKERFKAEYWQLRIRHEKLETMIEKWDQGDLEFTPTCPREIYNDQLAGMKLYRMVLEKRALIEGIDL